ncbi:MAG TPA: hypothetical protein VK730_11235 [Solirubrobacteraceae bacterium]|jgi:DNA-binding beta-propeller fold protein YncE|nr:hypothetical protein [Solirubrobacteraceae bacterium]
MSKTQRKSDHVGHRMNGTRLALLCIGVCLALPCASAQALITHHYLSQITGLGGVNHFATSAGNLWVAEGESLNKPGGASVEQFGENGQSGVTLPEVNGLEHTEYGVTVGEAGGEAQVYVSGQEEFASVGVVAVFNVASGKDLGVWRGEDVPGGSFGNTTGHLAFDDSKRAGDWASKDVLLANSKSETIDVLRPKLGGGEEYVAQITGPSSSEPGEPFASVGAIAVNQSNGDIVVVTGGDSPVIDVLEPFGLDEVRLVNQITGTPGAAFNVIGDVAVDSGTGEIYVANDTKEAVDDFNKEGGYVTSISGPVSGSRFERVRGVAVDPQTGDLYVGDGRTESNQTVGIIDSFGPGVVVPDVVNGKASEITPYGATLHGTVNPLNTEAATCSFEWGPSAALGETAPCTKVIENGDVPVDVEASIEGLKSGTTYYFRLQAGTPKNGTNTNEETSLATFKTSGPGIEAAWSSNVASTSANLGAQIESNDARTWFYFQYGTSSDYTVDTPMLSEGSPNGSLVGSGQGVSEVGEFVPGLQPSTLYHYRVVAVSEIDGKLKTFAGSDQTFTTQTVLGTSSLPDGRSWEMVSPPHKQGAYIYPLGGEDVIQAATSGDSFTYRTATPIETKDQGYHVFYSQVLSTREPGGWVSQDIDGQHATTVAAGATVGIGYEYKAFSPELTEALIEPYGPFAALSGEEMMPSAHERTEYLRKDSTCQVTPATCYMALLTPTDLPQGTEIEGEPKAVTGEVRFVGATPDLNHVVLQSAVVPLAAKPAGEGGLYEWTAGTLHPVTILPEDEVGSIPVARARLGSEVQEKINSRNAVSSDGSRVVWSIPGKDRLYVTDPFSDETVRLDSVDGGSSRGIVEPAFQTASSDGARVFFTDQQELTVGSHLGSLYLCQTAKVTGKLGCELTDLTPDANAGEAANVLGTIPGASDDGSYVYFVASGDLAAGASSGAPNLYVAHVEGERWTTSFIATLSGADRPDWLGQVGAGGLEQLTSRVSPDGQYLAFMSEQPLTGYDNRDALTGQPDEEVYIYNPVAKKLVCASCNPTGARPVGIAVANGQLANEVSGVWEDGTMLAASIPGWTPYELESARYQARYLSNSGRLFFDSSDALLAQDVNGTEDVYEYEPEGVHARSGYACTKASSGYVERAEGCLGLISSGTSAEESVFLDASESGGDVFFLTSAKLLPQDFDDSLDVYDAHECTGASPCLAVAAATPPPCTTGDACKVAPTPQPAIFGASGSAIFSGTGNIAVTTLTATVKPKAVTRAQKLAGALRVCAKRPKRKRALCRVQAKKRYGPKSKAGKSNYRGNQSTSAGAITKGNR